MPTYRFIDTKTSEVFESFMKISEREKYLNDNPHIETVVTAPAIVSSSGGSPDQKAGDGWKEVLSKVAEAHPSSTVGERYYKKSIKEVLAGNTSSKNYSNATWTYSPEQIATDLDIKVNVKRIEYDLWDLSKTELKGMLQDGHADLLHLQSALQAGADKTTLKKLLKDIVYLDQVMRAYASKD
jgi:hypothetical protein